MNLLDANLLLYAYDSTNPHHPQAREQLEQLLSRDEPVWLCWPVVLAFVRIATNPRLLTQPLEPDEAFAIVDSWLARTNVAWVGPGPGHWAILKRLIKEGQARGPLVSDAHLAALALEHGATLLSTDRDFARFPGLNYTNPLTA
ncbi:MAG: type II toxin-antitoxin system VapC family toxin [Candidatus Eremiobacteraeota bacterium]|nr:type II toxin-antitoxin system VapC family toxin [Candidatus Eremiobacteraeota bacterium]